MAAYRPLTVADVRMGNRWETAMTPSSSSTDIPKGEICLLTSGTLVAATATASTIDNGQYAAYITTEKFEADQYAAGAVPIQRTTVQAIPLLPGTLLECNYYYDNGTTDSNKLSVALIGATVVLRRVTVTAYGTVVVADGATSSSGKMTAKIVQLVDAVGTLWGRVRIQITSGFRDFA